MKKVIILILLSFVAVVITAQNSNNPINQEEIYQRLKYMKVGEIKEIMKVQSPEIYKRYKQSQNQIAAGSVFLTAGIVSSAVSFYYFSHKISGFSYTSVGSYGETNHISSYTSSIRNLGLGIGLLVTGTLLEGISIFTIVKGKKHKKQALNDFAKEIYDGKAVLSSTKIHPELNFGLIANGVGLNVNF